MTTRRELLKVGFGALPVISLSGSLPAFVSQLAFAGPAVGSAVAGDNILVVLQLSGGNDGLNTVVPVGNDDYLKARPGLGLKDKAKLLALNDQFAFNPGLAAFKEFFDSGQLAVVQGCGYPQPNRSHFQSMAIWHTGDPKLADPKGWLGHYLDHLQRGTEASALSAVNIGSELPQALVTEGAPVPSINTIDDFRVRFDESTPFDRKLEEQILRDLQQVKDQTPALQFLSRQSTNAIVSADQVQKLTQGYKPDAQYDQNLGSRLRTVAQIISGGFGTKVFYVETGGFDTHANQAYTHERLLQGVASQVKAFFADLKAKGLDEKVTVMVFSEFGRRVKQNDSAGTDHGAAGPMFVVGPKVKGGIYGDHPSLKPDDLTDGDLKYTTDFRRVYATLLDRWLCADSAGVLKNKFEAIGFL
jgi:uncharacterized protein (DUF1501 family)